MANVALKRLNQKQRIEARKNAEDAVRLSIGSKPEREEFKNLTISKYPLWLIQMVIGLSFVVLIAAFIPSAVRLYELGTVKFAEGVNDNRWVEIAGYCVVILAESGAILFTIAFAVLETKRSGKVILGFSIMASVIIALVGNFEVALLGNADTTLFTVLEALAPPLLTLATSWILKEVALSTIKERHAEKVAYEQAISEWKLSIGTPNKNPMFEQFHADAIWDMLLRVNDSGRGKTDRMSILSRAPDELKTRLVWREMQADNWFDFDSAQTVQNDRSTVQLEQSVQQQLNTSNTVQPALTSAYASIDTVQNQDVHRSIGFVQPVPDGKSKPEQIAEILRQNPSLQELSYGELLKHPQIANITSSKGTIASAYKALSEWQGE